ncbi:MAG TPA: ferritin family protein [Terracidiphilus sp.]|jgi:rubrerythrin
MISHVAGIEDVAVIRNLETALEEEMKNCAAYKAYAVSADDEGLHGLASLFRATALAEQIHASNHARVLRHMGGSTLVDVPRPRVESAINNLRAALVDQRFEVDYLYPTFLTTAVSLFDSTAVRSFHWALEADKSHARLHSEVITRVNGSGDSGWVLEPHDFHVCGLCGYAAERTEAENCPACNYLSEKFERVS